MSEETFALYLDPITGETIKWPFPNIGMPNLIRGPYFDESGSYYVTMIQIWPVQREET